MKRILFLVIVSPVLYIQRRKCSQAWNLWKPKQPHSTISSNIPLSLSAWRLVLHVVDSISATHDFLTALVLALAVEELLTEDGPVSLLGGLLDNNLLPVVADLVDDPLGVLAELELVEGCLLYTSPSPRDS